MLTYSIAQDPYIDLVLLPEDVEPGDNSLDVIEDDVSDSDSESLASDAMSIDTSII